jgi:hypothetical protein
MANNIIDFDQPSDFRREDWIGKGKIYSRKDLPFTVIDACTKAFAIPPHEMKWFLARNISVIDLLKTSLPPRSSALITSKPTAWFSNDSPRSNIDCLADRPIPNDAFLNELAAIEGQAWLNGAQSFVDPRFNDG